MRYAWIDEARDDVEGLNKDEEDDDDDDDDDEMKQRLSSGRELKGKQKQHRWEFEHHTSK